MSEYLSDAELVWQDTPITVEFSYEDFNGNKSRRKVDVEQVLVDKAKQVFYLVGFCHLRQETRHFRNTNITTMLKVKSKRFHFEEWLEDELGLDIYQILNSASGSATSTKLDLSKVDDYVRNTGGSQSIKPRKKSNHSTADEMADLNDKSKYHAYYVLVFFVFGAWLVMADGHIFGGLISGAIFAVIAIVLRALLKPKTQKNVWPFMRNLAVLVYICICLQSIFGK